MNAVLRASGLKRHYKVSRGIFAEAATLKALDGASFEVERGKTLAIVGESGCGKSTLARLLTMIETPTEGTLQISGLNTSNASASQLADIRSKVQIVFQNPYGSLNPRQKIGAALEEPLLVNTSQSQPQREEKVRAMMAAVGLKPEHYGRYPHMFSGGQRQRIAIARALMLEPEVLILDEPVSALDVSIQAQVLNLLTDIQDKFQLAFIFISHDLSVVRHIADDVMVMYLGKVVEHGTKDAIFTNPLHPYTRALLAATPVADPSRKKERIVLKGELPSPLNPPAGCAFNPRCPIASDLCRQKTPVLEAKNCRKVACFNA
jgi:dipeptide transport system ATP-binding protein